MKRANRTKLTPKERVKMYADQNGVCGCGCGELLTGKGDVGEHKWWFVALGNGGKPDALYRKECALKKTAGPRGDINTIAHVKRLAENRTQHDRRNELGYPLIEDRGFDKSLKKKLSGEVIRNG